MTKQQKLTDWIIFFLLAFAWGASFILMKKGLLHYTSAQVASLRLIFAGLFFLPFLFIIGIRGFYLHFKGLMWMGMFGNFIPAYLFTLAETKINSSLAGILNATTPLFAWIIGKFIFQNPDKNKKFTLLGLTLGFLGVFILFWPDLSLFSLSKQNNPISERITGSGLVLLATLCYGLSAQGIHVFLKDVPALHASAWGMVLMGILSGLTMMIQPFPSLSREALTGSLPYVAILGIIGSGVTLILYNRLIKSSGPVFASSCTYLIPFFSIMWGLLDGEILHLLDFVGLLVLISGLFFLRKGTN
ncbi:MAG: DMT family transporter [Bacteroidia bacterium]|nr:DMT family transporter [Bacteroidia bacterium]